MSFSLLERFHIWRALRKFENEPPPEPETRYTWVRCSECRCSTTYSFHGGLSPLPPNTQRHFPACSKSEKKHIPQASFIAADHKPEFFIPVGYTPLPYPRLWSST